MRCSPQRSVRFRRSPAAIFAAALLLSTTAGPAPAAADGPAIADAAAPAPERQLDWSLGSWKGMRKDPDDGSLTPMMLRGTKFLGGNALISEVEVHHRNGTVYRDLGVQALDPETGVWVEQYLELADRRFVRLEADDVSGDHTVWRSVGPDSPRQLQIVTERLATDRWRRTMSTSDDGGETWRVHWIDELDRTRGF